MIFQNLYDCIEVFNPFQKRRFQMFENQVKKGEMTEEEFNALVSNIRWTSNYKKR
jgi:hypothetical protein